MKTHQTINMNNGETNRYQNPPRTETRRKLPSGATGFTEEHPGLIVILVDQSASMDERWEGTDTKKCDIAAQSLNEICEEISFTNRVGTAWKRRVYLVVAGYTTEADMDTLRLRVLCEGWPSEFGPRWHDHGTAMKNKDENKPIEAAAYFNTPLAEAFDKTSELVRKLMVNHPILESSFPPVVINITDGAPDDMKPDKGAMTGNGEQTRRAAEALKSIETPWGNLVLINLLIDPTQQSETVFFDRKNRLSLSGQLFFDISSELPEYLRDKADRMNIPASEGARGFSITTSPKMLIKVLRWGSF